MDGESQLPAGRGHALFDATDMIAWTKFGEKLKGKNKDFVLMRVGK
ncbi:MAG: hypothetical protein J6T87_10400 [Bacteroidales bacterium]|nr:hypothetical protein [Bacteroidales bacterium]